MHWLTGAPAHVTRFGSRQYTESHTVFGGHTVMRDEEEEGMLSVLTTYSEVISGSDRLSGFFNSGTVGSRWCVCIPHNHCIW